MNACIDVATLLGYAAAGLLGLLVLGLLGALIYLARRLRISISLADGGGAGAKAAVADGAGASAGGAVGGVRKRVKAKKPAAASGATRLEILIGILLIGVAAVAVGLLIGIVI